MMMLIRLQQRAAISATSMAVTVRRTSTFAKQQPRRKQLLAGKQKNRLSLRSMTTRHHDTEYYYDSQSGKHVPVHDETHVNILLAAPLSPSSSSSSSCWVDEATRLGSWSQQSGLSGIVFTPPSPPSQTQNDAKESYTTMALEKTIVAPNNFQVWLPFTSEAASMPTARSSGDGDVPQIVHYVDYHVSRDDNNNDDDAAATAATLFVQDAISHLVEQQCWSAIACRAGETDAMLLASSIASILDASGSGADYVYLRGNDSDEIIQLAEELAYLDVEGPTLKSRMVIDLTELRLSNNDSDNDENDEQDADEAVEECLMAGINKYVVGEDELPWLVDFVLKQGKTCDVDASH